MAVRLLAPLSALLLIAAIANAGRSVDQTQLPPTYMPSGEQTYKQYCAACHGADAKGVGPLASLLKTLPPDLTTLAKRHLGKFPYDYVANVLEFGPGVSAHGSSDMPTWGRSSDTSTNKTKELCDNASRTSVITWLRCNGSNRSSLPIRIEFMGKVEFTCLTRVFIGIGNISETTRTVTRLLRGSRVTGRL